MPLLLLAFCLCQQNSEQHPSCTTGAWTQPLLSSRLAALKPRSIYSSILATQIRQTHCGSRCTWLGTNRVRQQHRYDCHHILRRARLWEDNSHILQYFISDSLNRLGTMRVMMVCRCHCVCVCNYAEPGTAQAPALYIAQSRVAVPARTLSNPALLWSCNRECNSTPVQTGLCKSCSPDFSCKGAGNSRSFALR